jgi:hypothetical protein
MSELLTENSAQSTHPWRDCRRDSKTESRGQFAENSDPFECHGIEQDVDFSVWVRKAYWTAGEAAALTISKIPSAELLGRIREAQDQRILSDPIVPREYLEWAAKRRIDVPDELGKAIEEHDLDISELKDQLRKTEAKYTKLEVKYTQVKLENQKFRYEADRKREFVPKQPESVEKPLHPKTEHTFFRLLFGLAVLKYHYHPEAKKQSSVANMHRALELLGLGVEQESIHRALRRAYEWIKETKPEVLANLKSE